MNKKSNRWLLFLIGGIVIFIFGRLLSGEGGTLFGDLFVLSGAVLVIVGLVSGIKRLFSKKDNKKSDQ